MIQRCFFKVLPEIFSITYEEFEIILHNLFPDQTRIMNVISNTSFLGELIAFDDPIPKQIYPDHFDLALKLQTTTMVLTVLTLSTQNCKGFSVFFVTDYATYLKTALIFSCSTIKRCRIQLHHLMFNHLHKNHHNNIMIQCLMMSFIMTTFKVTKCRQG